LPDHPNSELPISGSGGLTKAKNAAAARDPFVKKAQTNGGHSG
jgi:hypothetical protein